MAVCHIWYRVAAVDGEGLIKVAVFGNAEGVRDFDVAAA